MAGSKVNLYDSSNELFNYIEKQNNAVKDFSMGVVNNILDKLDESRDFDNVKTIIQTAVANPIIQTKPELVRLFQQLQEGYRNELTPASRPATPRASSTPLLAEYHHYPELSASSSYLNLALYLEKNNRKPNYTITKDLLARVNRIEQEGNHTKTSYATAAKAIAVAMNDVPEINNDPNLVKHLTTLKNSYDQRIKGTQNTPAVTAPSAALGVKPPKKTSLSGMAKLNVTLNSVNQAWQDKVNASTTVLPITSNDKRVQNLHNVLREIQVVEKSYIDSIKWLVSMVDTHTKDLRTNMSADSHKKFEEFMQPYRTIAGSPNPIVANKRDGTNVNDMIDLIKNIQDNVQLDNPLAKAGIEVNFTLGDFQEFLGKHKLTAFGAHISKPMQHLMRYPMLVDQVSLSLDKIQSEGNGYLITPYPEKIKTLKQTIDSAVVDTRFLPKLINKGHDLGQHHVFSSAAIQASVHKEVLATIQKENAAKANDVRKINPPRVPGKKTDFSIVSTDIKQMPNAPEAAGTGAHRRIDPKQKAAHDVKGKAPKKPIPSSSIGDGIARAPVKGASLLAHSLPATPWSIPTTPPPAPPGAARRNTRMAPPPDFVPTNSLPSVPKSAPKTADPEALRKSLAGKNLQQQSEIYKRKEALEQKHQQTDVKKGNPMNRRGISK